MTTRRRTIIGAAAATIAVVTALLFIGREPVHKGKTWSQWLEEVDYGKPDAVRKEARNAIREIGTKLLPRLAADLQPNGSPLKWRVISLIQRQTLVNLRFTTLDQRSRRAYWAIHALGQSAKPIAPELLRLFEVNPGYAVGAYAAIGPEAIPALTQALTHTNDWVRWNAASALRDFEPEETRDTVPLLAAGLSDASPNIRKKFGDVLRHLHPDEYERASQTKQPFGPNDGREHK